MADPIPGLQSGGPVLAHRTHPSLAEILINNRRPRMGPIRRIRGYAGYVAVGVLGSSADIYS